MGWLADTITKIEMERSIGVYMFENIRIFIWLFFGCYLITHKKAFRCEKVPGIDAPTKRLTYTYAVILILPIVLMAGYRSFWYEDTAMYYSIFQAGPTTFSEFIDFLKIIPKDIGFYGLTAFVKLLVSDFRFYLVLIAAFQGFCLMKLYRKYSDNYIFSLFLLVASTDVYGWMYNGIRQFTAVCITILAIRFFLEKKYVPAIIVILVASLFHGTALLLLPFIFIAQGEVWNKKTVLFLIMVVLAVTYVNEFTDLLDSALQETQYENVVSDYKSFNDDGTNPLRVLVYSIPAILSFFGRKQIREEGGVLINFCANMSIISAGFYLISMVTSGIFLGRLPIYFSLYSYILLPWELKHFIAKDSYFLVTGATIGFYMIFYLYSMGL